MGSNPTVTEKNLPDQSGKVFIVTGATSGIGRELSEILYTKNAKVYLTARSADKAQSTIQEIKRKQPSSKGQLIPLLLDLSDLSGIKSSAAEFLRNEKRLDVLFNNAGVMIPPQGSVTKQNYELQLGTNNLGPFLFTKLLTPMLLETAKNASPDSVRVVWVSSSAAGRFSPKGGVDMNNLDYSTPQNQWHKYGVSKAGNILHAMEFARRYGKDGVVSTAADPGNLQTDLYRTMPKWQKFFANFVLKEPIYGAYTELFSGFSRDISSKNNGAFVQPFGKLAPAREDIEMAGRTKEEGGTGVGKDFWDWSEAQVREYA